MVPVVSWLSRLVLPLVVALALIASGRPAAARPLPVSIGDRSLVVRAEAGLEDVARRLHAESGPQLASIATDLPDLPLPEAIEIRVVNDAADMQSVAPSDRQVPAWAAGVAFPDLGLVIVARRAHGAPLDIDETLHHELAHLALGAALGPAAPRWLHEGFAYQHSADWSWERTETLAGMAWSGNVIPLEELDHRFPAEELPVHVAYAESYDFVGFLAKRGRWEDHSDDGDRWAFRRFMGFIGHGDSPDTAAVRAFGRPLRDLFQEWREDLSRRFLWLPAGVFAMLIWVVAALLLTLGFFRRRRQNRRRLAEWERQEAEAEARRAAWLASIEQNADADLDGDDPDRPRGPPAWIN